MSAVALFGAGASLWPEYEKHLRQAIQAAAPDVQLVTEAAPETVDFIIYAPGSPLQDFSPYTKCKAVLNLWAGVERIVGNPTLTQPLCRMVDPGLTEGMVEYVTGHVLRHHLGMDRYILGAPGWNQIVPPLARERPVAVLGLGELGLACARALKGLNFAVEGWSRSEKAGLDIPAHHGEAGLEALLRRAEIVVTLLPRTAETENLLNATRLGWLPKGAALINPGRGPLIDDDALLAALDSGQVGHATLDVFRVEPLPEDHPFRHHPRVTVTPHIAADTRASSAARVIAENIRRGVAGEALLHQVDLRRGY
ncbi:2-hydroxyacid dehydrogenase [Gemmobacter serpentinus]|uniref:2-hydroxyacid dehydrogenase n=1 Tax=Gemmobacter serpentinus TaxID=2652247 RepID=UPI00124C8C52|nr:glyoxylate/hydroxypyruvate reductase A [Gemmobacter serpentinus]